MECCIRKFLLRCQTTESSNQRAVGLKGRQNLFHCTKGQSDQRVFRLMVIGLTGRRTKGSSDQREGSSDQWAVGPLDRRAKVVGLTGRRSIGNRTNGPSIQQDVGLKKRPRIANLLFNLVVRGYYVYVL